MSADRVKVGEVKGLSYRVTDVYGNTVAAEDVPADLPAPVYTALGADGQPTSLAAVQADANVSGVADLVIGTVVGDVVIPATIEGLATTPHKVGILAGPATGSEAVLVDKDKPAPPPAE